MATTTTTMASSRHSLPKRPLTAHQGEPFNTLRHVLESLSSLPEEIVLLIIASLFDFSNETRPAAWLTTTNLVKASPKVLGPLVTAAIIRARKEAWANHRLDPDFHDRYWKAPGVTSASFGRSGDKGLERRSEVFGMMWFLKGLGLRVKALRSGEIDPSFLPQFHRPGNYCPFFVGTLSEESLCTHWWYYYDANEDL